jgi:hypothetical protein
VVMAALRKVKKIWNGSLMLKCKSPRADMLNQS